MFRRKKDSLQSEVEYLRAQNQQLVDRLMALAGPGAHAQFHAEKRMETEEMEPKKTTEDLVVDKIGSIPAITEDERRQKVEAMEFAQSIIGGGSHA